MFNTITIRYRVALFQAGSHNTRQGVPMNLTAHIQRQCFQITNKVWLDILSQEDNPNHEYQSGTLS